MHERT